MCYDVKKRKGGALTHRISADGKHMTTYGYARCSTNETKQDITRQIKDLEALGVDKANIFLEYESGMKRHRPELERLFKTVREGDSVFATEVSRITRSTRQLCDIIEIAKERRLRLVFGSFVVDCTSELDAMTEGMLKMWGVFAESERNLISQRVKSGIANAKRKGKTLGRPPLRPSDIPQKVVNTFPLYNDRGISKADYARICGISRPTLDKYLRILAEG